MRMVYPVIFTNGKSHIIAYAPDFPLNTQGVDLADAVYMARDAIGLMGIDIQDDGGQVPEPSDPGTIHCEAGEVMALVDIDFDAYRRANDMRTIRKNLTLPSYLNNLGEKAGLNFSQVLQDALKQRLGV